MASDFRAMPLSSSRAPHTLISGVLTMSNQEIVARTDELTDTVKVVTESFPNLRADHRPNGADWNRWLIYDDLTSKLIGIVALGEPCEKSLSLPETKVLLRKRTLNLALQAA
jgi:hypothetical protein